MKLAFLLWCLICSAPLWGQTYIQGNNLVEVPNVVTSAAGTTTFTSSSQTVQILTGSSTQTFKLPNATTLQVGRQFRIQNNSTGTLTVQFNDASTAATVYSGHFVIFILTANGTSNGTWSQTKIPAVIYQPDGSVTAPSYAFGSDPNTGMYSVAADDLGFAVGGVVGFECKNIGSSQVNCGFGVAPSASANFPLLMQRSVNGGGVIMGIENTNTGTNSKACLTLVAANNDVQAEFCMGAAGSVDILDKAIRIRPTGNGKATYIEGGALSTGFIDFRVGGDSLSTGRAVTMNANKTTTFYNHPILQIQGAGSTPTCSSTFQGALALTNGLILCVCNGAGATWKKVSDGTTTCTF